MTCAGDDIALENRTPLFREITWVLVASSATSRDQCDHFYGLDFSCSNPFHQLPTSCFCVISPPICAHYLCAVVFILHDGNTLLFATDRDQRGDPAQLKTLVKY